MVIGDLLLVIGYWFKCVFALKSCWSPRFIVCWQAPLGACICWSPRFIVCLKAPLGACICLEKAFYISLGFQTLGLDKK